MMGNWGPAELSNSSKILYLASDRAKDSNSGLSDSKARVDFTLSGASLLLPSHRVPIHLPHVVGHGV